MKLIRLPESVPIGSWFKFRSFAVAMVPPKSRLPISESSETTVVVDHRRILKAIRSSPGGKERRATGDVQHHLGERRKCASAGFADILGNAGRTRADDVLILQATGVVQIVEARGNSVVAIDEVVKKPESVPEFVGRGAGNGRRELRDRIRTVSTGFDKVIKVTGEHPGAGAGAPEAVVRHRSAIEYVLPGDPVAVDALITRAQDDHVVKSAGLVGEEIDDWCPRRPSSNRQRRRSESFAVRRR